jgi:hypothetical protein
MGTPGWRDLRRTQSVCAVLCRRNGIYTGSHRLLNRIWLADSFTLMTKNTRWSAPTGGNGCNGLRRHFAPIMSAACFSSHPHVDDFRFLKDHTRVTPKMTIPAPNMLHFRPGRRSISKEVYPDLSSFFEDVAYASRKAVRAFYDAGCRFLQFDDTTWSMMCDERERAHSRERGDEPEKLPAAYARMINRALEGKPADMTVTMHSCRGNFRSTWIRRAATSLLPNECSMK